MGWRWEWPVIKSIYHPTGLTSFCPGKGSFARGQLQGWGGVGADPAVKGRWGPCESREARVGWGQRQVLAMCIPQCEGSRGPGTCRVTVMQMAARSPWGSGLKRGPSGGSCL